MTIRNNTIHNFNGATKPCHHSKTIHNCLIKNGQSNPNMHNIDSHLYACMWYVCTRACHHMMLIKQRLS